MEVKSVYMDLVEWEKRGNVWKLESEAFKDPIEIKIWYDNHELKSFEEKIEWIKHILDLYDKKFTKIQWEQVNNNLFREEYQNKVENKQYQIDMLREKLENLSKENKELIKVVADQKTMIEMLSGTLSSMQDVMKLMQQKLAKQPTVIHDKAFISWRESTGLWVIELRDGDYLMIAKYKVWEHNEYVVNEDELLFDRIHVEGQHYIPFYKLEWGTELDTPTAEIHYDLIFIPI